MDRLPSVQILVKGAGKCPALRSGDRMVYAHPGIESERTCGQALAVLAPAAEDVARATAEGRPMEPLTLNCPLEGCGATFVLTAITPHTPVELGRAPQGRPGADAGARPRRAGGRRGGKLRVVAWVFASLIILAALAAGAMAGVVYYAPHVVPPLVMEQLRAWGIPLPGLAGPAPAEAPRSD